MKVLINAYACCPEMGSEPGMAWNWCINLAQHCELFIITEGEFKESIEKAMFYLPQRNNLHFYYNPVSEKVRKMCWNQGDWRFYKYYNDWQKKTLKIAEKIVIDENIDIIHQLNMIGFREPGYLWKVSNKYNIPFVWGPIGGLKKFPMKYADGGIKQNLFLRIKNFLNIYQLKYDGRVAQAFKNASILISSIPDSYRAIKKHKGLESIIIPETGTFPQMIEDVKYRFKRDKLTILWVGKLDFRKRLDIALKSIALVSDKNIIIKIFGTGNEKQISETKKLIRQLNIENKVFWEGNKTNDVVQKEMQKADLFLFTSVNEDTSTVVLEAVSNHLPVLCFDTCGMSAVIDENIGYKIALSDVEQSVADFAKEISFIYENRDDLINKSINCKKYSEQLSWHNKAKKIFDIYKSILNIPMQPT